MQKMLEQMGQKPEKVKRILEVNPTHPLVPRLAQVFARDKSDPRLAAYAKLLYGQAHLAEAGNLPDPVACSAALSDGMLRAV